MTPKERLDTIARQIRNRIRWPANADGVVLSSGPAVRIGATDPTAQDITAETIAGASVRRLIAPHLTLRETFVVHLHDGARLTRGWDAQSAARPGPRAAHARRYTGNPRMARVALPDYLHFGSANGLHLFGKLMRFPSLERLLRTPVPTLAVIGARDPLMPPPWRIQEVGRLAPPHLTVAVIEGAAHAMNYSHPGELAT
jgi:pimeloyl-ACP methyl ester carboxylesterase